MGDGSNDIILLKSLENDDRVLGVEGPGDVADVLTARDRLSIDDPTWVLTTADVTVGDDGSGGGARWVNRGSLTLVGVAPNMVTNSYPEAIGIRAPVAPVFFDLNGDREIAYNWARFNVDDGQMEETRWVDAKDGVLVWDKYQDGLVHDVSQWPFAQYGDGDSADLQGLAQAFDSNQDGVFDRLDAMFEQFVVWQDRDADGVNTAGDLTSLAALGVARAELSSDGLRRHPVEGVTAFGHAQASLNDGSLCWWLTRRWRIAHPTLRWVTPCCEAGGAALRGHAHDLKRGTEHRSNAHSRAERKSRFEHSCTRKLRWTSKLAKRFY